MKEIFKTFISLTILLIISILIYLAWIINKGGFSSQYLEKFINDRFKTEKFYTAIKDPKINFDKDKIRIIVSGRDFKIFSIEEKKISEFKNLKVYINFIPLITKRKLVTNKIEMVEGKIYLPSVFHDPLIINSIDLEGNLNPNDEEIFIDNFSTSMKEDLYEGSVKLNLKEFQADGFLTKLSRKKIFQNLDLNSDNMKFLVTKNEFNVEGNATLGDVDVFLKGKKNYKDKSKYISKYNVSANIDENDIEKSFNFKISSSNSPVQSYINGPIELNATYLILQNNKEKIKTSNNLKETEINFPYLGITKEKGVDASADIDFNFSNKKLKEIKIINYKQGNNEINGSVKLSKEFKPYKSLELNLMKDDKKISIKVLRNKDLNNLDLKGDYFDFSKTLQDSFSKNQEKQSFLEQLDPLKINLQAKEVFISEDKTIYDVDAILNYEKKLFKDVKLNAKFENEKKFSVKFFRNKDINNLDLKGDYFDFSKTLKETFFEEKKEDNFLIQLQPLSIDLKANEILVAEEKSIYKADAILKYENKIFKDVKLSAKLNNEKTFNLRIKPKENSREIIINSDDAGLFLKTFNINKSGKEGEFILHGNYDDTEESHPLNASVTIRDMRLIKAPTLAKILNLASIGIVSALSGEGILINKLKSEFVLNEGVLDLNKYEAYGPDIGFSNQGKIYLRDDKINLEGAMIPMVTLNKIIGSIPVLGKILTNERKGIWSFAYTITGPLDKPEVKVNPIKTITPGFIQKFFSVFKTEKKEKED